MNNEICIGYLINIRDMFVVGSERCEDEALKYHQNFISALNYAIELINAPAVEYTFEEAFQKTICENKLYCPNKRPRGEWIIVDDTEQFIAKCSVCGRIEDSRMVKNYPYCHCGAKMQEGDVDCMDEDAK